MVLNYKNRAVFSFKKYVARFRPTKSCGRLQVQRDDPFELADANFSFYEDLDDKLYPKLERIQFEVFNPEQQTVQEKFSQLQIDTNSDAGISQPRSQSDLRTEDDGENIEEVQTMVPSRNRYLSGIETTDSPKGLLPLFPSWSCLKMGPFATYSELKGRDQKRKV